MHGTGPEQLSPRLAAAFDKEKARDRGHEPIYLHLTANSRACRRDGAAAEHVGNQKRDVSDVHVRWVITCDVSMKAAIRRWGESNPQPTL